MKNDTIIVNCDGENKEINILEIFEVNGYPDKQYILYVFPGEMNGEDVSVHVSILHHSDNSYSLENILDDQEFDDISKAISEIFEED